MLGSGACAKYPAIDNRGVKRDVSPMSTNSPLINLTRDIEAIQIPSGLTKKLEKGTPVIITQALGGTYTVVVEHSAGLFRVLAQDADALGKLPIPAAETNGAAPSDGPLNEDAIWTQLKTCYDPEIPVNIVDLGLIYSMEIKPQNGGNLVEVKDDPHRARLRHGPLHRFRCADAKSSPFPASPMHRSMSCGIRRGVPIAFPPRENRSSA